MAAWRRRALELFPHLQNELQRRDSNVYSLLFDLEMMAREAHNANDEDLLRRIYGFAEWCSRQTARHLRNAAWVMFYEYLLDDPAGGKYVIPWLSPRVVADHWQLWEAVLSADTWEKIRPLLAGKRDAFQRQTRLPRRR